MLSVRTAITTAALLSALAPPVVALAAPPVTSDSASPASRILSLQDEIERNQDDINALDVRLEVTNAEIFDSRTESILRAHERDELLVSWSSRIVALYKEGPENPLEILLGSRSLGDLYLRATGMMTLARADRRLLDEADAATLRLDESLEHLEQAKQELLSLKTIRQNRVESLAAALGEQRALLAKVPESGRSAYLARVTAGKLTRKQWRESSIPVGTPIAKVPGTVQPYSEQYLVSEFHPNVYRATGEKFSAVCSWYGNQFNGRPTACGQIFNQDDFTCAHKTLPFGTRIALTRGDRRIVVVVTDRGPFHPQRDLDLSKAAAEALGFSGVVTVQAEFVEVVR